MYLSHIWEEARTGLLKKKMFTKELESYSLQINKVGLVLLDFKLVSILLGPPSSWRWSSGGILGVQGLRWPWAAPGLRGGLRVRVQVCGKEEQELEEVHLVLQLWDERLLQHVDQAAAEGLDLLLHVHHGDVVPLLGLGLDSFDY